MKNEKAIIPAKDYGSNTGLENQSTTMTNHKPTQNKFQCFNCDEKLHGKEFAVGVCNVSAAHGITALLPLCLECCEFLENGNKDLIREAFTRLISKTLSRLKRRNIDV